jgi:hypothetical protein
MTIYVVWCVSGNWDASEWMVKGYRNREDAERHAREAEKWLKDNNLLQPKWDNNSALLTHFMQEWFYRGDERREILKTNPYDPTHLWELSCGEQTIYSVRELEVG